MNRLPPFVNVRAVIATNTTPPPDVLCRVISAGGGRSAILGSEEAQLLALAEDGPSVILTSPISLQAAQADASLSDWLDRRIPFVLPIWVVDFLTKNSDEDRDFSSGFSQNSAITAKV
jgi:hypothetical protein